MTPGSLQRAVTTATIEFTTAVTSNSAGNSDYSNPSSVFVPVTLPDAPTNLFANSVTPSRATLSWTDNSFNETAAKDNADALDRIKASGKIDVHYQTEAEKQAWIKKLMPVHKEMQSRFGKGFIENIYKASGFVPPQS